MNIFKKLFGKKEVEEIEEGLTHSEKYLIYMCAKYEELTNKKIMILILKEYRERVMYQDYDESILETPYLKYVRELDNPVPDYSYRKIVRDWVIEDYEEKKRS